MSKYTQSQARAKAQMVVSQLGGKIKAAVAGTGVDPAFLAGKIGVEAGVRGGKIVERATRFEAHVYAALKAVRDGKKSSYNKITKRQLIGASDAALRALATSFGVSQIMGWHMINNLAGTVADLRNPDKHLIYTIQLMMLTSGAYMRAKNYEAALRIWNTGKPTGKTYDPDYVHNALAVMKAAKPLIKDVKPTLTVGKVDGLTMDVDEVLQNAQIEDITPDPEPFDDDLDDDGVPDSQEQKPPTQQADNIINLGDQAGGSGSTDGDTPPPPKNDPTDLEMKAPPAQDLKSKIRNFLVALGVPVTGAGITAAVSSAWQDGTVNFREAFSIFAEVFRFVLPYATYVVIAYVAYKTIQMIFIQFSFIKRMEINGNPDLNNIKIASPPKAPDEPKTLFSRIF